MKQELQLLFQEQVIQVNLVMKYGVIQKMLSEVWDKVWEAGKEFDITPLGLEALDMVRIEAGLIFYGYEFDDQTDPFEAGIGFTVPLKTKEDDFIGKGRIN